MPLTKQDMVVMRVLLVCMALAAIPVFMSGFGHTMFMLWLLCLLLWAVFQGALWKGHGTKGLLLAWFAHLGAKRGLTALQVYGRGRTVMGTMIFIIPLLYFTAK